VEFSVNYSIEAIELLSRGEIRVDRIKCADWPEMISEAKKAGEVYVHFPFDVGAINGRVADVARAQSMIEDTDTPYVNFHVVSYARDYPELLRDSTDAAATRTFTDRLLKDINCAIANFGRSRVIVENIPWFGATGEFHRFSVDPDLISRAVKETGVGFLLDISHARIAAHYLNVDARQYIERLPLDHLRELHVTGIRMHNGRLADHLDLQDEDWTFFDWAIDRIKTGDWSTPWTVAFEYGGIGDPFKWRSSIDVLRDQVPRLYEKVKRIAP
jgi:sugar phosphate isomerase/epimerase